MLIPVRRALAALIFTTALSFPPRHPAAAEAPAKPALRPSTPELREKRPAPDIFAGVPTERLTLRRAIEMALENNLEVQFERAGINVERGRIRFAAGAFDPVFSVQAQRQSLIRAQDISNPSTAQSINQQTQLQLQLNQAAQELNSQLLFAQQQTLQQGSITSAQLQQQLAAANQALVLQGLPPIDIDESLLATQPLLLQQQPIVTPQLNNEVVLDQRSDTIQASLQGRTPLGTRYAFEVTSNRFRNTFEGDPNPVNTLNEAFAGLTVVQPLLRNFGTGANLADLRVARINQKIQVLDWKQNIATAVQGVMATYYDMLAALRDIEVRQSAIAADTQLVDLYRRRVELGFSSPIDIQQAQVAVSIDREQLLVAKNIFMERQFALKRLIFREFQIDDPRIFLPADAPRLSPPPIDRSAIMRTAFEKRYDYQSALLTAEAQDVRLRFARNQVLPQLDIFATAGLNGLSDSFTSSFDRAFSGETPQWTIGVNFQVPLGNVQPRAQLAVARGLKEQAILRIKQSELTVGVDVDTVISRIQTFQQRVESARQTRELGEEAVRVAYRRLEEGLISAYDILEQQRRLYDAKSRELAAMAELEKAVTQLWLVTGTVLDRQGVGFREPREGENIPLGRISQRLTEAARERAARRDAAPEPARR
jgi:outer membrane protein